MALGAVTGDFEGCEDSITGGEELFQCSEVVADLNTTEVCHSSGTLCSNVTICYNDTDVDEWKECGWQYENCSSIVEPSCLDWDPNKPLIPCRLVPPQFYQCLVWDLTGVPETLIGEPSEEEEEEETNPWYIYGCDGWSRESIASAIANCTVLEEIECSGERTWTQVRPCQYYGPTLFPMALAMSLFLGCFGVDRMCTGHLFTGILKMGTLGGVGFWYVYDLISIINGDFTHGNGQDWLPTDVVLQ